MLFQKVFLAQKINSNPARPSADAGTNLLWNHRLVFRYVESVVFIFVENTDLVKDLGDSEKDTA